MSKRLIQLAIVCTIAALVTSCEIPTYKLYEGAYKIYKGPPSPPDKIATLFSRTGFYIVTIDGLPTFDSERLSGNPIKGGFLRIELLPGEHTISIGFRYTENYRGGSKTTWSGEKMLTFHVEAGKTYIVEDPIDQSMSLSTGADSYWNPQVEEVPERGVIPQVTQPDRAAEIYFIREGSFWGDGWKSDLIFDGINFFPLGGGKYTMIKADPGKHSVGLWVSAGSRRYVMCGWNKGRKEFDFQSNQKYYFAIKITDIYRPIETFEIILLSTSDGEAAVKKSTYVPYRFAETVWTQ
jgi:hypothetical protein